MNTDENNQEVDVDTENNEGEVSEEKSEDVVKLSKEEYDKIQQDLGSAKRELKDLKKAKETQKETPEKTEPENALLEKVERLALRQAGVDHADDIELAKNTAKKWGMDIDEVLSDEDFKVKLERQQSNRSNVEATSNLKGGSAGSTSAKNTPEYWQKKGIPPTPADVPDSITRRKIVRSMLKASKGDGKMTFYNS